MSKEDALARLGGSGLGAPPPDFGAMYEQECALGGNPRYIDKPAFRAIWHRICRIESEAGQYTFAGGYLSPDGLRDLREGCEVYSCSKSLHHALHPPADTVLAAIWREKLTKALPVYRAAVDKHLRGEHRADTFELLDELERMKA